MDLYKFDPDKYVAKTDMEANKAFIIFAPDLLLTLYIFVTC